MGLIVLRRIFGSNTTDELGRTRFSKLEGYVVIDSESRQTRYVDVEKLKVAMGKGLTIANAKLCGDSARGFIQLKSNYKIADFPASVSLGESRYKHCSTWDNHVAVLKVDNSRALVCDIFGKCMGISIEELAELKSNNLIINAYNGQLLGTMKVNAAVSKEEQQLQDYYKKNIALGTNSEFEIENREGNITLKRYSGNAEFVKIPEFVTCIGESAFINNKSIKRLIVAGNVKIIKSNAFASSNIEEIVLGEGIEKIEAYAFRECNNMNNITLPKSVRHVGERLFAWNNVKRIDFMCTSNDLVVDKYVFSGCKSDVEIHISKEVAVKIISNNIHYYGDENVGATINIA